MTEVSRKERNSRMLGECYPAFALKLAAVLRDLAAHDYRPRIQCAWRSPTDQIAAFNSGHSQRRYGFHNVTDSRGEPQALAADVLDDDAPLNPSKRYLLILAACARAHDLDTGIQWGLSKILRSGVSVALASRDWDAPVRVGWDPCHVQVRGITPQQARRGEKP